MRQIHETEFPNSVEATEQLLIEQGGEYTKLKVSLYFCFGSKKDSANTDPHTFFQDEILAAGRHGEEILAEIRRKAELCVDKIGNISSIER